MQVEQAVVNNRNNSDIISCAPLGVEAGVALLLT